MNKKIKVLTAAIALVGILSVGAKSAWGAADKNSQIDINDIIRLTTSNNSELSVFKQKIEVRDKWYHDALEEKSKESNYQKDMRKYINPFRRQEEIKNLEWQKDQKQDEVVLSTTKAYYDIMLQNQMIELQEKKIERLKKLLEYKKEKIKIGTEAATSLIDDETNLKDAEMKLQQLKNSEESLRMELNMKIGNPVDKKLNLKKAEIPYKPYEVKNLEAVIEKMLTKSHTITSMIEEQKIDIKEKDILEDYENATNASELERAANPSGDYKARIEDLEDQLIELKYKMDDEKKSIEAKIRMDYNSILNAKDDVQVKKLDYEKAQTLLKTEKAKFDAGRSTKIQCDAAEESVLMASCEYNRAKLNYYVAVEKFKNYNKRAL
ncbi:TolC family protein [Clostridium ganghwense]|uniref:TolC family protein n=1 Tax=Clostridium ganghwense TaxID=312089 RepID=A0ABT4CRB5_9CLOT|nr:TolC family protein [Clostridium ganghwense]MCY6370978.1 TolC family protein [Clostridium ganghwense]